MYILHLCNYQIYAFERCSVNVTRNSHKNFPQNGKELPVKIGQRHKQFFLYLAPFRLVH